MTQSANRSLPHRLTDLLEQQPDGALRLLPGVHPFPDLPELEPLALLDRFKTGQAADFARIIGQLDAPGNPLRGLLEGLRSVAAADPGSAFPRALLFDGARLHELFRELHAHVMEHPVWRHPFFLRFAEGAFSRDEFLRFALHYFNQVKNTRQCVALALGRFHGLMPLPYGVLNERVSELVQTVLAQLLADEYGVSSAHPEDFADLRGVLDSVTHMALYRRLFDGLGVPFAAQDVPLLPEVADNVLTQRLVAGDPAFTRLEALASVGLGMEWGVPEFFSLLLRGMVRWAWRAQVPLTREHLSVFIAHVEGDVLHAVAVMLVTSLLVHGEEDVASIKGATNLLMASRHGMMTGLYREVFAAPCPGLADIDLEPRYRVADRRIEAPLRAARREAEAARLAAPGYGARRELPFVFL